MSSERCVVVTGAGRGIGRAIAIAFAAKGDHVFLVSRSKADLDDLSREISSTGGNAVGISADIGSSTDVERLFKTIDSRGCSIDVLVNSAGLLGPIGLSWEVASAKWWNALQVNLFGTYLCCRAALKVMAVKGSGSVINLSGGGATSPMERFSGYGVSKAGVVRLTETLAVEAMSIGVRVNAIAPGMVDTGIHDEVLAAGKESGGQAEKVNRMRVESSGVSTNEAADLALWLASSDSEPLTGKLISAAHDPWREWRGDDLKSLSDSSLLTLRRMDKFTIDSIDTSGDS